MSPTENAPGLAHSERFVELEVLKGFLKKG